MSRDESTFEEGIRDELPGFVRDTSIDSFVVPAAAAVLARVEGLWDDWLEELFRETASLEFLDALAEDRGKSRFIWETDEQLRERAIVEPEAPTPSRLEELYSYLLGPGEGWNAEIREPRLTVVPPNDDDGDGFGFFASQSPTDPDDYPSVYVADLPLGEVRTPAAGSFAAPGGDIFAGGFVPAPDIHATYVGDQPWSESRWAIRRIAEDLKSRRPAGSATILEIEDRYQPAHTFHAAGVHGGHFASGGFR